jgi:hypothetical protein
MIDRLSRYISFEGHRNLKEIGIFKLFTSYNLCMSDDLVLATHYRNQASRFRALAAFVPSAELTADLRAAGRMYEGFAKELEKRPPHSGYQAVNPQGFPPKCRVQQ